MHHLLQLLGRGVADWACASLFDARLSTTVDGKKATRQCRMASGSVEYQVDWLSSLRAMSSSLSLMSAMPSTTLVLRWLIICWYCVSRSAFSLSMRKNRGRACATNADDCLQSASVASAGRQAVMADAGKFKALPRCPAAAQFR